jgi:hypothetical protein
MCDNKWRPTSWRYHDGSRPSLQQIRSPASRWHDCRCRSQFDRHCSGCPVPNRYSPQHCTSKDHNIFRVPSCVLLLKSILRKTGQQCTPCEVPISHFHLASRVFQSRVRRSSKTANGKGRLRPQIIQMDRKNRQKTDPLVDALSFHALSFSR